jgi:hypothetical protein
MPFVRSVLDALGHEKAFDGLAAQPYRWGGPGTFALRNVTLEDGVTTAPMEWKDELLATARMIERFGQERPPLYITEFGWGSPDRFTLKAESMLSIAGRSYSDFLKDDVEHLDSSFAKLRDDPELDFVKTALWFAVEATTNPALGPFRRAARFGGRRTRPASSDSGRMVA